MPALGETRLLAKTGPRRAGITLLKGLVKASNAGFGRELPCDPVELFPSAFSGLWDGLTRKLLLSSLA
jgi:hypothetical protein